MTTKTTNRSRGKKCVYKGITFASIFEADVAYTLDKLGLYWEYESKSIPWLPSSRVRHYVPDFFIREDDGTEYHLEAKGYLDPMTRTKMIAVKKQHPDLDIRFVFQRPTDIVRSRGKQSTTSKRAPTTVVDWALKKNYDVVDMEIEHANVELLDGTTRNSTDSESKKKAPRKSSKRGAQSSSSRGRSTRTKNGDLQEVSQKKQRKNNSRSKPSCTLCA